MKQTSNCNRLTGRLIKLSMLVAFVLFEIPASFAATFYFSASTGNDSYNAEQAQHPNTPWRTIDKLNAIFHSLGAGDSVLLKRGDVFDKSITVTQSGSAVAPIYIGAYGKGAKPVISGLEQLKTWTLVSNGIYESDCNIKGLTVVINGSPQAMGRFPNQGYLSYNSHNENNSITDKNSTLTTDWKGAEVVIRKNRWVIDKSIIVNNTMNTITYVAGTKSVPTNGYGYFIQNSVKTLDQFGEWYFDAAKKKMLVYFGNKNPALYRVAASATNSLVEIAKHYYIVFDNLAFVGAGLNAFNIKNSSNITVKNCMFDMTGANAISAVYTPFINITNTLINHTLNDALNFDIGCTNAFVTGNEIKNTGTMAGMGESGTGTYEAITAFGDNTMIEKNRIDSTGYDGIYMGGNSSTAKNNFINYFCFVKDDGGGIYIGDWSKTANKKVIGNIVMHGMGAADGSNAPKSLQAEGIYIDDNTESVTITGNTVSLCANNGVKIHNAKDVIVTANTVFDNGTQLRMEQDHYLETSSYIRNNNVTNNIFFSKNSSQPNAKYSTHQDDISSFGRIDSNFYSRPDDLAEIRTEVVKNGKNVNNIYDLADWKPIYNKDNVSVKTIKKTPAEISSNNIRFEYNASNVVKVVTLNKPYLDVHNQLHKDRIEISPYSSVILIAANTAKDKKIASLELASR